jgi:hypothetical protein
MDRPSAGLIRDLEQRGLLYETLVVWGGEFGRTPMQENRGGQENPFLGRDHHSEAFTMWVAGAGIKPGFSYGETDEIGYAGVSGRVPKSGERRRRKAWEPSSQPALTKL